MKKQAEKKRLSQNFLVFIIILVVIIAVVSGFLASAIILLVPFILFFFIVEILVKNESLRKILWIAYIIITAMLLIQEYSSGESAYNLINAAIIFLCIIVLFSDKKIQKYLGKN